MHYRFLSIICAGVLLLVTAFALATPGLRKEATVEKPLLSRVLSPSVGRNLQAAYKP